MAKGEEGEGDDYNPYAHRKAEHPTTNFETLIHIIKGAVGTGILAMPEAFKNSGIWNGLISTAIIGIICTYCLHVLFKAQYEICKELKVPNLNYPETMKAGLELGPKSFHKFSRASAVIVDVFLMIFQIGLCCVYIIFVAMNIKSIFDEYTETKITVEIYVFIFLPGYILLFSVRNYKLFAPFSIVANVLTIISFGIVCYYIFQNLPHLKDIPAFGPADHYPLFLGTTLFAFVAVAVIVPLENGMKNPECLRGWFGVLNIAMSFTIGLYIVIGFLGYWRYEEDVKSSITLNLKQSDITAKIVKALYSIAIFISYGLNAYVPLQISHDYLDKHIESTDHPFLWDYLIRIIIIAITSLMAVTIPLLGLFISLFGAFCLSGLGIGFPAIIDFCVRYPDKFGFLKVHIIKDIFLLLVALVALVIGTYIAVLEIVRALIVLYS